MIVMTSEMKSPETRIQEIELWAARLDGRNNALWDRQHDWNEEHAKSDSALHIDMNQKIAIFDKRLQAVEKKIILLTAAAAAGGGIIGQLLEQFLPI